MKNSTLSYSLLLALASVLITGCFPQRSTTSTPSKPIPPNQRPPQNKPTTGNTGTTPNQPGTTTPTTTNPGTTQPTTPPVTQTYRVALLLPFLTNQFDANTGAVPEKSTLANQFYAGTQMALKVLSTEGSLNLQVDVLDTKTTDAEFEQVLQHPRLQRAQVLIGPIRPTHVTMMAEKIKTSRQILLSPKTPNMDLTAQNPDFIQTNPSLKAHCEAIVRHVRSKNPTATAVLLCKQKEVDRLPYFQNALMAQGSARWAEVIVPDANNTLDGIDLSRYMQSGRTTVIVVPSWSSQDFIMGLLRKLKAVKGSARVEVYGMPQWRNFENIEPEYLNSLRVHITSATYVDYKLPEVQQFQQQFYEAYGTIPDEDAFTGYDVTLFTGRMLKQYGLNFPKNLQRATLFNGLQTRIQCLPVSATGTADAATLQYDYLENKAVRILRFDQYGFVPAD